MAIFISITSSVNGGTRSEALDRVLDAGSYYIRVYPYSGSSKYNLRVSTDTPTYSGTRTLAGTFGADTFDVISNYTRTVISGGGNVDFGSGYNDVLNLSGLLSTSVSITYANDPKGGVFYDPGNGTRVFDSILLNDGRQILFEGIDRIEFSDSKIDLSVRPNDPLFNKQWNLSMMDVQGWH
jgi:serine protease